jgi:hypothetical protein
LWTLLTKPPITAWSGHWSPHKQLQQHPCQWSRWLCEPAQRLPTLLALSFSLTEARVSVGNTATKARATEGRATNRDTDEAQLVRDRDLHSAIRYANSARIPAALNRS